MEIIFTAPALVGLMVLVLVIFWFASRLQSIVNQLQEIRDLLAAQPRVDRSQND